MKIWKVLFWKTNVNCVFPCVRYYMYILSFAFSIVYAGVSCWKNYSFIKWKCSIVDTCTSQFYFHSFIHFFFWLLLYILIQVYVFLAILLAWCSNQWLQYYSNSHIMLSTLILIHVLVPWYQIRQVAKNYP